MRNPPYGSMPPIDSRTLHAIARRQRALAIGDAIVALGAAARRLASRAAAARVPPARVTP